MTAGAAVGAVLVEAAMVAGVVGGVRVIRRGPDLPLSHRLDAAGGVCMALALIVAVPASLAGFPLAAALIVVGLMCLAGGALIARLIVAFRERREAERVRRALGQPRAQRMLSPWALGAIWFVAAIVIGVVGAFVVPWVHPPRTQREVDQEVAGAIGAMAGVAAVGVAHVAYQCFRLLRRKWADQTSAPTPSTN